jgi:creatinine amidohydrolase
MALRTDTTRAEMIADLVARRLSPRVVVTPAIPIGVSDHHLAFPGTLTLSPQTLTSVIQEVVESLYAHGWRWVFLLTGHGGNNSTADVAASQMRARRPDLHIAWSRVTPLADDVIRRLDVSEVRGHSCEIETSQALHLDPSLGRPAAQPHRTVAVRDRLPRRVAGADRPGMGHRRGLSAGAHPGQDLG